MAHQAFNTSSCEAHHFIFLLLPKASKPTTNLMKYYIIAGEASGDLHGSNLMKALLTQDPEAEFRFWGGDNMEEVAGAAVRHIRDLAFMGFVEVIKHLRTILGNIKFCKKDIEAFQPDVLVLIDYPGFNLRIAAWAKQRGIKIAYYISPQIWAWKEGRVKQIRRDVDKMLVILPFEKDFYAKHNMQAIYVGHPLSEVIETSLKMPEIEIAQKPIIALLPGSRKQEIQAKLPVMLSMIRFFPKYHFVIAQAPAQEEAFYQTILRKYDAQVPLLKGNTYQLLRQARAALVTSGTATLETALLRCPQIVCYRGNPISYLVARRLIRVKYISLVNLILDRKAVPELIQDELNTENLRAHLEDLLKDTPVREAMLSDYDDLWKMLAAEGASAKAATEILSLAKLGAG